VSHLPPSLSLVVLTYNEERNLRSCLESVGDLVEQIFVVDSGSTDRTIEIARECGAAVVTHAFDGHAAQWQWALSVLPITSTWVLALDADQSLTPELRASIAAQVPGWTSAGTPVGAYLNRRQVFRGRWIRFGGYYPKYLLKLFRRDAVRIETQDLVDHHFEVNGPTATLSGDLIERNRNEDSISVWIDKHNRYAVRQAREEEDRAAEADTRPARPFGSPDERTRWQKKIWYRLPIYVRPFFYFIYRYLFRLGFLDGKQGFVFHFMQAFWYRLLVDINRDEIRRPPLSGRTITAAESSEPASRARVSKAVK
jgi:glycosyltransferase involved in cell wall biosynthesis